MTWQMTRNSEKKCENEKSTLQDMEYGENTDKQRKWEIHIIGPGIWQDN